MIKAKYLTPAVITPSPERDEKGRPRLTPENKIQFPMVKAPDGRSFYMAFTDSIEFRKWKQEEENLFALAFPEYAGLILRKGNPAAGVVINPFGSNVMITREMIVSLAAAGMKRREEAQKNARKSSEERQPGGSC